MSASTFCTVMFVVDTQISVSRLLLYEGRDRSAILDMPKVVQFPRFDWADGGRGKMPVGHPHPVPYPRILHATLAAGADDVHLHPMFSKGMW